MIDASIGGFSCRFARLGYGKGPAVLWAVSEQELERLDQITTDLSDCSGIIAAFVVTDWNRDLSPWKAPAAFGANDFTGEGNKTFSWLKDRLIPYIQDLFEDITVFYTAGYSLGGLFALWAMLQTSLISGCASCSGSLWFPGMEQFLQEHPVHAGQRIYLSLGTHEERTRNPIMCRVGEMTRKLAEDCRKRGASSILEWNPGGHFRDVELRMERGLRWILSAP